MKRLLSVVVAVAMLVSMAAGLVSASTVEPPTVDKTASPTDINISGSGVNELTTITLTVTGAGGTSTTTIPMDVVFALDSSGSMGWNDPGGLRKSAAKSFVDKMDSSRDTSGVVSWDDNIDFTYGLSGNFPMVKTKIDQVDADGGTNLNVGLNSAIAVLDANPRPANSVSVEVIIFLTDGAGTYDYAADGGPAATAADAGYVIYSIGLGPAQMGPLQDMADFTGGQAFTSPSADNLQAIFDAIFTQVVTSTIPYYVDVVEVTQSYIVNEGSFNPTPTSVSTVGGITTIRWDNIGMGDGDPDLSADETVTLTFTAESNQTGQNLDVDIFGDAKVYYEDKEGNPAAPVNIPQAKINVNAPPDAVCKDITIALDDSGNASIIPSDVDGGSYDPDGDPITLSIDKSSFICTDLGVNSVTLTVSDGRLTDTCTATVTVVDTTAPVVGCVESVNPHGNNIPGENRGKNGKDKRNINPDGFYELSATDICDAEPDLWIGTVDNPYLFELDTVDGSVVVKLTEAQGAVPSCKKIGSSNGQAGAVSYHITLPSDPVVTAVDESDNVTSCTCLVPPPPM